MQRLRLCKSWKLWEMLKMLDGQPPSLKQHLRRCWIQLETVWVILQVPTMRRMGKTRMMKKIQSLASWAKMTHLAGCWVQSPKQYSTAWRVFGKGRWGLTNCQDQDVETWLTPSIREKWSMGRLNSRFRQLWSPNQRRLDPHHHRRHLDGVCRLLKLSPDNHKSGKWRLNSEVVKWSLVRRNHRHTFTDHISWLMWYPSRHRWRLRSLLNP